MKKRPEEVLKEVIHENDLFVLSKGKEFFEEHIERQNPLITLITCSDARVQPSIFSSELINRVFVIRNIGNQLENSAGSVDYGVFHLQTPLLLILGHVHCGAIKTFLSNYADEAESIRCELDHLHIPLSRVPQNLPFEDAWLKAVEENVHWQVRVAMERYGVLVKSGKLAIIGAVYDFANRYGKGYGRVLIINVNGLTDRKAIPDSKPLTLIPNERREDIIP